MSEEIKRTADSQSEAAAAGGEAQHHQEAPAEAQAPAEAKTPAEATANRPADSQSEGAAAGGEAQHHQEPPAEAQAPAEATANRLGPLRRYHDGLGVLHQRVYTEDEQDTETNLSESQDEPWYSSDSDPNADEADEEAPATEEMANRSGGPAPEEKANNRSGGPAPDN